METELSYLNEHDISRKTGKRLKQGTPSGRFFNGLLNISFVLIILFGITTITLSYFFSINVVEGASMMTTLNADSRQIVDGVLYEQEIEDSVILDKHKTPERGDIIVVETGEDQHGSTIYHIKRLIAVEGDQIKLIRDNTDQTFYLVINGVVLDEPYLDEFWGKPWPYFYQTEEGNTVLDNTYYNIYNNFYADLNGNATMITSWLRANSDNIIIDEQGDEAFVIPEGTIFYLGDNRKVSNDCMQKGPQPVASIVGTVTDIIEEEDSVFNFIIEKITIWIKGLFD